jgi:hypothetical protein
MAKPIPRAAPVTTAVVGSAIRFSSGIELKGRDALRLPADRTIDLTRGADINPAALSTQGSQMLFSALTSLGPRLAGAAYQDWAAPWWIIDQWPAALRH